MAEIVADMMSSMILVIRAGSVFGRRAEFLVPQAGLGVLPATASRGVMVAPLLVTMKHLRRV